jgi:hypothetical protein
MDYWKIAECIKYPALARGYTGDLQRDAVNALEYSATLVNLPSDVEGEILPQLPSEDFLQGVISSLMNPTRYTREQLITMIDQAVGVLERIQLEAGHSAEYARDIMRKYK